MNLTQDEAAQRAKLDMKYWQFIERGRVNLKLVTLARIAKGLGVTVAELVTPAIGRAPTRRRGRPRAALAEAKPAVKRTGSKKK